jgi:acetyl-CoA carboxylase carboxyltransferase component
MSTPPTKTMRERVAELEAERTRIAQMGGPDKVQKQHERGKLTARERLARFYDGGKYFELGMHGTQMGGIGNPSDKPPADAVICGYGEVAGTHGRCGRL